MCDQTRGGLTESARKHMHINGGRVMGEHRFGTASIMSASVIDGADVDDGGEDLLIVGQNAVGGGRRADRRWMAGYAGTGAEEQLRIAGI